LILIEQPQKGKSRNPIEHSLLIFTSAVSVIQKLQNPSSLAAGIGRHRTAADNDYFISSRENVI
jgi:hypothetical protein